MFGRWPGGLSSADDIRIVKDRRHCARFLPGDSFNVSGRCLNSKRKKGNGGQVTGHRRQDGEDVDWRAPEGVRRVVFAASENERQRQGTKGGGKTKKSKRRLRLQRCTGQPRGATQGEFSP